MKNCELCKVPARTYCESDQASLCWDCDAKVHEANFLVARHSRTLLCHTCQSLTPWKASGVKLGNTISLCCNCTGGMKGMDEDREESEGGNDNDIDTEDYYDDDDCSSDDDDDDAGGGGDGEVGGDEDGDNQVVPLSSIPPPPVSNSSSSEGSISRCNSSNRCISETVNTISLKRKREDASHRNFQNTWKRSCNKHMDGAESRKQVVLLECERGEGTSIQPLMSLKNTDDCKTPKAV